MTMRSYTVYILTNASRTLYVGVTGNLPRRIEAHRSGAVEGFTRKYRIKQLVYAEEHAYVWTALEREKQIKRWRRAKKIALIESLNPSWRDLAGEI